MRNQNVTYTVYGIAVPGEVFFLKVPFAGPFFGGIHFRASEREEMRIRTTLVLIQAMCLVSR